VAVTRQNLILLALAILISLIPLVLYGDFAGTDDKATDAIGELRPDYKPWFAFLWEPSDELEPYLFMLQGGLGAAFIAYFAWRHRRRPVG
jgi:cobalt/nickel transport protein